MLYTPFPEIDTARLRLRRATQKDCQEILFLRSDEDINRYIKRPKPENLKDAEDWLDKIDREIENDKCLYWSITLKNAARMIGSICLWNLSEDRSTAEVGYDLAPDFHNRGIMTEALQHILGFGFQDLGLKKIEAFTDYRNESSKRLLVKNGFTLNHKRKDEDNLDNVIFEIMRSDFKQFTADS